MKIYIEDNGNGIYGINRDSLGYMSNEQVNEYSHLIVVDSENREYIDTDNLPYSEEAWFDRYRMESIAETYDIDVESLWDILDWQSPYTLGLELSE